MIQGKKDLFFIDNVVDMFELYYSGLLQQLDSDPWWDLRGIVDACRRGLQILS